jgi:hypothetical protein
VDFFCAVCYVQHPVFGLPSWKREGMAFFELCRFAISLWKPQSIMSNRYWPASIVRRYGRGRFTMCDVYNLREKALVQPEGLQEEECESVLLP